MGTSLPKKVRNSEYSNFIKSTCYDPKENVVAIRSVAILLS